MASKVDWSTLQGYKALDAVSTSKNTTENVLFCTDDFSITVEATCPTGFEAALDNEIREKLPMSVTVKHQGRVFFDVSISQIKNVLKLRCMDNAYVIIGVRSNFDFPTDIDDSLNRVNTLLDDQCCDSNNIRLAWKKGIIAWNEIFSFKNTGKDNWYKCISLLDPSSTVKKNVQSNQNQINKKPKVETKENVDESNTNVQEMSIPKFRATCYRSGKQCHPFGSMDIARSFGGAINDKFGWDVSMKNFDIEIVITIDINQIYVGIGLTKTSLFRRNIEHFGPTTLRATICASMLQLANIEPGEIVVDPMCGGGSIPIEGAIAFNRGFHIGGDYHEKAVFRSSENFESLSKSLTKATGSKACKRLPGDILQWDVTRLPLRDNSVDAFITDLPFGKRSGSMADNRVLYPKIMNSMARVVKPCTGRAIVLTQDKTSMFKAQGQFNKFWKINRQYYCNIGGLKALVFVMTRTQTIP